MDTVAGADYRMMVRDKVRARFSSASLLYIIWVSDCVDALVL
jgi:hypothetical protein